ncbi:MAG TPA: tRNA (cytidine(34)-2'-O)-methyltransferase, partial [Rhizobiaceae bacterium]|nr:tRNA (cytidine(34)-2'-O)-methyltransferase [Rhizobiaceae bacterium]
GAILRLGACLGMPVEVIGPTGFDLSDRALKRAGMDYLEIAALTRHDDWDAFLRWRDSLLAPPRLILLTTKAARAYTDFTFSTNDILLFGRESAGAPDFVHAAADARLTIPMAEGARSLNLALAAAMVAGEATKQVGFSRAATIAFSGD